MSLTITTSRFGSPEYSQGQLSAHEDTKATIPVSLGDSATQTRILLGIFSTSSPEDYARRQMIRNSYLSNFKTLTGVGLELNSKTSICSLNDLKTNPSAYEECQMVYTFVVGAYDPLKNDTVPTDLTEAFPFGTQEAAKYIADRSSRQEDGEDRDVIYLNIAENMNSGKTVTWFRYASSILMTRDLGIDLIAKVDLDAVLFPRPFLQDINAQILDRPAQNIYGGYHLIQRQAHEIPYMQGGFYFLSTGIAQWITSNDCPRHDIIQRSTFEKGYTRSEDREIGLFVDECIRARHEETTYNGVKMIVTSYATHNRSYKKSTPFRVRWKEGLAKDIAYLRRQASKKKYAATSGCPPSEKAAKEDELWFDLRKNMGLAKRRYEKMVGIDCSSLGYSPSLPRRRQS